MTHASLFSGIGGFDLAAEWVGWENAFNCEINDFCNEVLKYHFPNTEHYDDIKTTDFPKWRAESIKAYGNAIDPDTGCLHAAQVAWNAIAMLHFKMNEYKE